VGERRQYAPGTFSWTDLSTPDPDAAKAFYGALFGWQAEDVAVPGGAYYSMQRIDGKDVAAIAPQPQAQRDAGAPPAWQSYITVASADAAAARAAEVGGTVHAPPFDVMDAGRMAVIQDPQGAFFMLWEPKGSIGAGLVNAPGALCWNELAAADLDAAPDFYSKLLGWRAEPFEGGPMRYLTIKNGDATNGGMREKQPEEPTYWLVYFAVEDADAGVERVEDLGGGAIAGPFEMAMGKIAVVRDPQGAVFALYSGELEP
jgi:predicted enzyme related to lactoylglutathione lyase